MILSLFLSSLPVHTVIGQESGTQNGQTEGSPAPTETPAATPTPIPISTVVTEAKVVNRRIEEIKNDLDRRSPSLQMDRNVAGLTKKIDEQEPDIKDILDSLPSLETLGVAENEWKKLSTQAANWNRTISNYLETIDERNEELRSLLASWSELENSVEKPEEEPVETDEEASPTPTPTETEEQATVVTEPSPSPEEQKEEVPEEVRTRIDGTIKAIEDARKWLAERRAEILRLQARLGEQFTRIENTLKNIRNERDEALSKLIVKDSPAIWDVRAYEGYLGEDLGKSFTGEMLQLREYFNLHWQRFLAHLLIILLLYLGLLRARRHTRKLSLEEPGLKRAMTIFEVPLASALVLTPLLARPIYPEIPNTLRALWRYLTLSSSVMPSGV